MSVPASLTVRRPLSRGSQLSRLHPTPVAAWCGRTWRGDRVRGTLRAAGVATDVRRWRATRIALACAAVVVARSVVGEWTAAVSLGLLCERTASRAFLRARRRRHEGDVEAACARLARRLAAGVATGGTLGDAVLELAGRPPRPGSVDAQLVHGIAMRVVAGADASAAVSREAASRLPGRGRAAMERLAAAMDAVDRAGRGVHPLERLGSAIEAQRALVHGAGAAVADARMTATATPILALVVAIGLAGAAPGAGSTLSGVSPLAVTVLVGAAAALLGALGVRRLTDVRRLL